MVASEEELEATLPRLLEGYYSDDGADAQYWHQEGTKWGAKFYFDVEQRDENYQRQVDAHYLGIAPEVGDKLECVIHGVTRYGFITQHIKIAYYLPMSQQANARRHLWDKIKTFDEETQDRLSKDLHNKNWGIDDDGEPLIIDFSRQSSDDYTSMWDSDEECDCSACRGDSSDVQPEELPE